MRVAALNGLDGGAVGDLPADLARLFQGRGALDLESDVREVEKKGSGTDRSYLVGKPSKTGLLRKRSSSAQVSLR